MLLLAECSSSICQRLTNSWQFLEAHLSRLLPNNRSQEIPNMLTMAGCWFILNLSYAGSLEPKQYYSIAILHWQSSLFLESASESQSTYWWTLDYQLDTYDWPSHIQGTPCRCQTLRAQARVIRCYQETVTFEAWIMGRQCWTPTWVTIMPNQSQSNTLHATLWRQNSHVWLLMAIMFDQWW